MAARLRKPIFLVGYMCSGKTTLGKEVARQLGVDFIDLDEYIEHLYKRTISDIFAREGETVFRDMEAQALMTLNDAYFGTSVVIALGGGTPCSPGVMERLNSTGLTVYLETSTERIVDRLIIGGSKRPLIVGKSASELKKYVEGMIEQRKGYYEQAQHRFDSTRLETAEETAVTAAQFISNFNLK